MPKPKPAPSISIHLGITYTTTPVPLVCDIYRPASGGPFPVVFMIVDGFWQSNYISQADPIGRRLAGLGYAAIAPKLRTAPTYHAPAPMEDCARLIDFVVAQAAAYSFDANNISAMGGSGGGHVASFMSLGDYLTPAQFARVRCVVEASAPTALREMDADGAGGDFTTGIEQFLGVTEAESPETWELFSPALRVTSATKPMLVQHSATEVIPPPQGQRLADALAANGIEHQFTTYPGDLHGWALIQDAAPWAEIVPWLREHL